MLIIIYAIIMPIDIFVTISSFGISLFKKCIFFCTLIKNLYIIFQLNLWKKFLNLFNIPLNQLAYKLHHLSLTLLTTRKVEENWLIMKQ